MSGGANPGIDSTAGISVLRAIHERRSVRAYTSEPVQRETIVELLDAAVRAPTAMHQEPWAFAVIQDRHLLHELSTAAHATIDTASRQRLGDTLKDDFNIFYDAGTLILICARPGNPFVAADCWLAAENLMLAAYARGLGTCVIGFAVAAVNSTGWKERIGIPAEMEIFAPIIVGVPAKPVPAVPRQEPRIMAWKQATQGARNSSV